MSKQTETNTVVVQVRSPFNYDVKAVSDATGLACRDPSRADQSQAEDADINTIVRRFGITGQLPSGVRVPTYGDFDLVSDYQSALSLVEEADKAFLRFPADVRSRFENDPGRFIEFCSDPANLEEARKLGLAPPGAPPTPPSEPPKA